MKLFIGISPGAAAGERIGALMDALRTADDELRWVPAEILHVTLVFLGEVAEGRIAAIARATEQVVSRCRSFELRIESSGMFGRPSSPRTLWLGVNGELEALRALQRALEQALVPLGFIPERAWYTPHLTVARSRRERGTTRMSEMGEELKQFVSRPWRVEQVTLFVSRTGRYEPLAHFRLDA